MINILYLGENIYNGDVTFIEHLCHQWRKAGIHFWIWRVNNEILGGKKRKFTEELEYENMHQNNLPELGRTLVVGLSKKTEQFLPMLSNATVLGTDPSLDYNDNSTLILRNTDGMFYKNPVFVERPFTFGLGEKYSFDSISQSLIRVGYLSQLITIEVPFRCYIGTLDKTTFKDVKPLLQINLQDEPEATIRFFGFCSADFHYKAKEIDPYWSRHWHGIFPKKIGSASAIIEKAKQVFILAHGYRALECWDTGLIPTLFNSKTPVSLITEERSQLYLSEETYNTGIQIAEIVNG